METYETYEKGARMKVVYISAPFTADTAWGIEQNIRIAEEAALSVWKLGAVALCPHTNSRFFFGSASEVVFKEGYLELVRRSDLVYMVGNCGGSSGANTEIAEASKRDIPI
ncbi:hypothetical protein LCGC14_1505700, partial [marine sediment metagenome]